MKPVARKEIKSAKVRARTQNAIFKAKNSAQKGSAGSAKAEAQAPKNARAQLCYLALPYLDIPFWNRVHSCAYVRVCLNVTLLILRFHSNHSRSSAQISGQTAGFLYAHEMTKNPGVKKPVGS
jgi:hypothetical protein